MLRMTALETDIAAKCASARFRVLRAAKRQKRLWLEVRAAAWAKERDELEANAAKVAPSGSKSAFRIERRTVTVVFD